MIERSCDINLMPYDVSGELPEIERTVGSEKFVLPGITQSDVRGLAFTRTELISFLSVCNARGIKHPPAWDAVYDEADYEAKLSAKDVYGMKHFTSLCAADVASFTYAEFHALSFQKLDTDGVAKSTDPGHLLSEAVLQPEGTAISDDDIGELLASAAASVFSLLKLKLNKLVTRSCHYRLIISQRLSRVLKLYRLYAAP